VVVNMVDPGFCKSSLQRNNGPVLALLGRAFEGVLAKTAEEGARMLIWGALLGRDDPALRAQVRGAYTARFEIAEVSDWVLSREGADAQSRVWVCRLLPICDMMLIRVCTARNLAGP
jgi:retinol dehydrogenase-12